jgi:DNA-binding NtrC family response regulator
LITGEAGAGHELIARALHDLSARRQGPFVGVRCEGIPNGAIERELFGHDGDSPVGAHAPFDRRGRLELANNGTLFLEGITHLSLDAQGSLLRLLDERTMTRVGGTTPIPIDVRLVAATHVDVGQAVRDGRFREDLYHRLNVGAINVPPLRERRDDVPMLVAHLLARMNRGQSTDKTLAPEALERIVGYDWPGNLREMEGLIERLVTLPTGPTIQESDLPPHIRGNARTHALAEEVRHGAVSLTQAVDAFERELILDALERTSHVQVRAAKSLGITRRILKYKMDLLGIPVKRPRTRTRREAA